MNEIERLRAEVEIGRRLVTVISQPVAKDLWRDRVFRVAREYDQFLVEHYSDKNDV